MEYTKDNNSDSCNNVISLDTNKIGFYADINGQSINTLIEMLYSKKKLLCSAYKKSYKNKRPNLYLFIRSKGGCLHDALAAFDHIKRLSKYVRMITISEGFVASGGTLLFCAGEKRLSMRNCTFLFHQLSTSFSGKYKNLEFEKKDCDMIMKKLVKIYNNTSSISISKINRLLQKELIMSACKCIKNGFVHGFYK
jgi:ATP-dependent protease ClpP protease subunit